MKCYAAEDRLWKSVKNLYSAFCKLPDGAVLQLWVFILTQGIAEG